MDILESNSVLNSIQQNDLKIKKLRISFKVWMKKFFVKKNVVSLIVIFIILMTLTQMSMTFGYRMGMVDSVKKQSQMNFWLSQNILGLKNTKSESDWYVFWDVWSKLKNEYVDNKDITDEKLIENAIRGIVNTTNDQFSEFMTYKEYQELNGELAGSFEGIGAEIGKKNGQIVIVAPLKDSPAQKAGLRSGDMIVDVDGKTIVDMTATETVKLIRGKGGTKVKITIYRESIAEKKVFEITRSKINIPSCEVEFINDNIAVLRVYNFYDNLVPEFMKSLEVIKAKNPRGIIVDLRNNPGGYLDAYLEMGNNFFKKGDTLVSEDFGGKREAITEVANMNGYFRDKKMVILINGGTASAAEILAGALRDNNKVLIVGEKSFGKGSVQELMPLKNNNFLKLTIAHWLTPKGTSISKKGIVPDIEVKLTDAQINDLGAYSGINLIKDLQLKRAVEELNKIIK